MKIKELIKLLSKYPEDTEVSYEGPDLSLNAITTVVDMYIEELDSKEDSKEPITTIEALIV